MSVRVPGSQFPKGTADLQMTAHLRIHGEVFAGRGTEINLIAVLATKREGASVMIEEANLTHSLLEVVKDFGSVGNDLCG